MNAYLMIENPGIAPAESFTLLGASTKRGTENSQLIGKFGTGNKQAIGVFLRHGLSPIIFASNLRMEFSTRPQIVSDGLGQHTFNRVYVKFGGKDTDGKSRSATEDLGYVLEHGATDWTTVDLGLREFISNALDRAISQGEHDYIHDFVNKREIEEPGFVALAQGESAYAVEVLRCELKKYRDIAKDYKNVVIKVVDASQVRAKAGFTRIFVPLTQSVLDFYNNLDKWFLHFNHDDLLNKTILPKGNRSLKDRQSAVIYRRGVRVREFEQTNTPSLFDYNLEDLKLDEARKVDDWYVQYAAAQAIAAADEEVLIRIWESFLSGGVAYWEHSFSSYGLETGIHNTEQKKRWQAAFDKVAGDNAVISTPEGGVIAARKGFKVVNAPEAFVNAADKYGIATPAKVLSLDQRMGREIFDSTPDAEAAVDFAWSLVVEHGLTNGKERPAVKTFRKIMDAGSQTLGFYNNDTVYINQDIAGNSSLSLGWHGLTQQLLVTALEEVAHHVTQATDFSRDFQDFILNLLVYMAKKQVLEIA